MKGLEDLKKKRTEPQFSALPRAVKNKLENSQIQKNSGGGSCLYKAAMQHVNAGSFKASDEGFESLRKYAHEKLVEFWPTYEEWYTWPMTVRIGSGEQSRLVSIEDADKFKEFLMSEESLHSYNTSEVDLWILSYVLHTHVYVLTYNLPDKTLDDRPRV